MNLPFPLVKIGGKTHLAKVFIESKSLSYSQRFHNFKTNAVNKAYISVIQSEETLDPFVVKF